MKSVFEIKILGRWICVLLGIIPQVLLAAILEGRVVGISDGDTLKVLDSNHQLHTVRLMGIDAPEKAQPFGQRSKQSLSEMVFQKPVTVEWQKRDRYGRIIGKIIVTDGTDICLEQINRGLAWHYKQYSSEQSVADKKIYSQAENVAKKAGVGLWGDAVPIPPWEWRRK